MSMPPVPPPRNAGETLTQYMARLDEWSLTQGAAGTTSNRPTSPEQLPPGAIPGAGGVYYLPQPNGVTQYFTPQRDAQGNITGYSTQMSAAGASGGAGGINYATQQRPSDRTREDLIAAGGRQLGSNTIIMPGSLDKYTLGTNGYYGPFGRASRDDVQALMRAAASGATGQATTPGATRPGDLPVLNPVQGNQAPLLSSFSQFTTPGREISAEGLKPMYTGSGLNTLVRSPNGPNIAQVPPGVRPIGGGYINNYTFGGTARGEGGGSPGVSPAYAQFPTTQFMVPEGYKAGPSGFSSDVGGGSFVPIDIPFGVTGPSLTGPGGAGVLQMTGPQNINMSNADRSVGWGGIVNSPMAYNNIGLTYGRDLGGVERDAARGAVESAMLYNAQQQYGPAGAMAILRAVDPGAGTGQPGLYGNLPMEGAGVRTDWGDIFGGFGEGGFGGGDAIPFGSMARGGRMMVVPAMARGGRAVVRPLGTSGRKELITTEPMALVGMMTGRMHGMVGEDNADRDRMPDPEMLRFGRNSMSVTPLDPVRMAEGGNTRVVEPQVTIRPDVTASPPGEQPVGDIPIDDIPPSQPPVVPPVGDVPPVAPPPLVPYVPEIVRDSFDALNPDLIKPWQAASRELAMRDAVRNRYNYRFRAAGLSGP